MDFHIFSLEHGRWWRAAGSGYTDKLNMAGTYTEEEAADIVLDHVPPGEEISVPVKFAKMSEEGLLKHAKAYRQII